MEEAIRLDGLKMPDRIFKDETAKWETTIREEKKERWSATISVGLIVINADRSSLLVRKRDTGLWALPAGGFRKGERAEQTAIRELKVELKRLPFLTKLFK